MNPREILLAMEREERYLFHGSPFLLEGLEPYQAVNFNRDTGEKRKDGDPCVFATHLSKMAILAGLAHPSQFSKRGCGVSFGTTSKGILHMEMTFLAWWEIMKGKTAYVYVFLREEVFSTHAPLSGEWRIYQKVKPLKIIMVSEKDLPKVKIIWFSIRRGF
jgi:hypothetical protein